MNVRTGIGYAIRAFVIAAFAIGAINIFAFVVMTAADQYKSIRNRVPERWANLPADANREAWLQTWLPWWDRTRTKYESYIGFVLRPMKSSLVTIGEHGYRVHHHRVSDSAATRRVTLYGSSQIWGSALSDDETIGAQLELMLPDTQVANHALRGVSSRTTFQAMLNDLLSGERPDVVVMVNGAIDMERGCLDGDPRAITDGEVLEMAETLEMTSLYGLFLPTETLLRRLRALYGSSVGELEPGQPPDCAADPKRADEVARRMRAVWEHANELAAFHGMRFIAVFEPSPYIGKPDTGNFIEVTWKPVRTRNMAAVYAALIRQVNAGSFPWFFDLSDIMDGRGQVYVDPGGHLVPRAATAYAQRLATIIDSNFRRK